MKFRQCLLVSLGLLSACSGKLNAQSGSDMDGVAGSPETWVVDSSKAVCQGVSQQLCLKVRQPQAKQFQFIYDPIHGLDYSWGHTYTLAVQEDRAESAPQDASRVARHVTAILDVKEDVIGTVYSYRAVNLTEHTLEIDGDTYRFLGQAFTCANSELCAAVENVKPVRQVNLEFIYVGEGEIELVDWQEVDQ